MSTYKITNASAPASLRVLIEKWRHDADTIPTRGFVSDAHSARADEQEVTLRRCADELEALAKADALGRGIATPATDHVAARTLLREWQQEDAVSDEPKPDPVPETIGYWGRVTMGKPPAMSIPSQCSAANAERGGRCLLNHGHGGEHAFLVDTRPYEHIKQLEAEVAALRDQQEPSELALLTEEFCGWWHLNREGSVNAAYEHVDALVKKLRATLGRPAVEMPSCDSANRLRAKCRHSGYEYCDFCVAAAELDALKQAYDELASNDGGPMTIPDPDPPKSQRGLYGKFIVRRVDGTDAAGKKHDGCAYFVLDLTHDKHAVAAIRAYARSCEQDYPMLAHDLRSWADGNKLMEERTHG